MKKHMVLFIVLLLCQNLLVGQRNPDAEIEKIANSLAMQLKNKGVKMAAVADFTYQGQTNTRIGKYLADELSSKLTMQGFSMMNRDKVREGMAEQEAKKQSQSNKTATRPANDSLALWNAIGDGIGRIGAGKALKGVGAVIYGDIEDWEDDLRVVIQMTKNNAKRENIGAATGNFIKTPQIRRMVEGAVERTSFPESNNPPLSSVNTSDTNANGSENLTFSKGNLTVEITGCRQTGQDVECRCNIIPGNRDDSFCTYLDNSKITSASNGHEFYMKEMRLADAVGTGGHTCKSLIRNIPIEASFKYTNVTQKMSIIARLDIKCYLQSANDYFYVTIYNIPVR